MFFQGFISQYHDTSTSHQHHLWNRKISDNVRLVSLFTKTSTGFTVGHMGTGLFLQKIENQADFQKQYETLRDFILSLQLSSWLSIFSIFAEYC